MYPRQYVQNKIVDIVNSVTFPIAIYDAKTRKMDVEIGKSDCIKHIIVKETSKSFTAQRHNKRELGSAVDNWTFVLEIEFYKEVELDNFDEEISKGITLSVGQGFNGKAVFMPVSCEIEHPTNVATSGTGTVATYTIAAVLVKQ